MSINKVFASGRLTRDPELRATPGGTSVLGFGIAVNERKRDPNTGEWTDYANFFECAMFGKRADAISALIHKGDKVSIEGRLRYDSWTAKDGTKRSTVQIVVDEIEFMSQQEARGASKQANMASGGGYAPNAPQNASQGFQQAQYAGEYYPEELVF